MLKNNQRFGRVLNSVYEQHKVRHYIMVEVERIRSVRKNESCVFNECYENLSGIGPSNALSIEICQAPELAVNVFI